MIKLRATREKYDGYYELNSLHAYSSCAKTVTRMANDINAWDLYGNTIKLICEDYLIHTTHRTFRAWLLPFSFIIGQP